MTGFEPATPATRTQCATKLRYIPIFYIFCILSTLTQFGFNWNLASVSLAKCATFRFFTFIVFYRPSRSLVLIGIWLSFHSPSALFRFFTFIVFYRPSRSLVIIGIWLSFHSPSALFRFFTFIVFYRPSRSLALIGIWLPFHSPSALHSDFLYFCI